MIYNKDFLFSIAVDGSSASGKTTGSKIISKNFGFNLLSSGKLYRYVAYKLIKDKKKITNKLYLRKITKKITLKKLKSNKLYNVDVTNLASSIAKIKFIRNLLKKFQKNFSKKKKIIIEGRDIASKIIPNAEEAILCGLEKLSYKDAMAIIGTHCLGPAVSTLFKISFDKY